MKSPTPRAPRGAVVVLSLVFATLAHADPASDYRDGFAAYHAGQLPDAMQLLSRAAEGGNGEAAAFLGYVLDQAEEDEQAVLMYRRAVELGEPGGAYGLGMLYAKGEGVDKDDARAVEWLTRAAESGHGEAALVLGEASLLGDFGLPADREAALRWMERGAAAGYAPAAVRLAEVLGK